MTFLVEFINADRLTVKLDFLVMFQGLKEICSRPFCLFYCFFCSVPNFPVLLAFFLWEKPCEAALCPVMGGSCSGASPGPRTLSDFVLGIARILQENSAAQGSSAVCPELSEPCSVYSVSCRKAPSLQFLHGWSPKSGMPDHTHTGQTDQPAQSASCNSKNTMGSIFKE